MAAPKRKLWKILLVAFVVLNILLFATGKIYYYKALVYNYVNIDDLDLFATREIAAGTGEPWAIGSDYNKTKLTPLLEKTLNQYKSVAFLVIKNDSLRYEQYWDNYSDSSLSNSFSMAKSFVGTLTGIALAEGKIKSLDEPACNYLKWMCGERESKISIRDLLTMSSGLNWDEGYASLTSEVTRLYYDKHLDKQMMDLKAERNPGEEYNYMSCNTELLAFILCKATGMTLSDYASEKLWKPMHAEHSAQWSLDEEGGMEKAYCCIYSNARDFARLGKLFMQKGRWGDTQVVPESYVNESLTAAALTDNGKPNKIYGYQWWLTRVRNEPVFYARGILGQYIFVIPSQQIICVRLGHKRGEKGPDGDLLDVPVYLEEVMKLFGTTDTSPVVLN